MTKQKRERYVSPKGVAIWPRLSEPDYKFKPEGEFSARLAYDGDDKDYLALKTKLERIRDEAFQKFLSENPKKKKKAKVVPVHRMEEDDEGDETGREILNFKMRHKVTRKRDNKEFKLWPTVMNAKREILKVVPNVSGGSVLRVSFEVNPYFNEKDSEFGLSLRMVAVQIIDLVEFGSRTADRNDFDDEDGYDGSGGEESSDDDDSDDADDDSDDGDGDY